MKKNNVNYDKLFDLCLNNDFSDYNKIKLLSEATNLGYKLIQDLVIFSEYIRKERIEASDNIKLHSDLVSDYQKILQKTVLLSQELKLNNSLEIATLYTYLLHNGYFSKNKELNFGLEGRHQITGLYALDIVNGCGTCLNVSDMLKDLLNLSGFDSAIIKSDQMKKKIKINKLNHAFNLIAEGQKFYIYDSLNLFLLMVNDKFAAENLTNGNIFYLNPYWGYALNFGDQSIELLDKFRNTEKFSSPYNKDYVEVLRNNITYFKQNRTLLSDYYAETKENIDSIANKLILTK